MSGALISLTPMQWLGIPVALVGSVFLAGGAILQQRGVAKGDATASASGARRGRLQSILGLVKSPTWLLGTGMLAFAIVIQLFSLYLAPLTVVQPLGAFALVVTAFMNARLTKSRLPAAAFRAILLCVAGIGLFVGVAAVTTTTAPIDNLQLLIVILILAAIVIVLVLVHIIQRKNSHRLFYVVGAGVLFGFVATLAKSLITRVQTIFATGFHLVAADWLTVGCVIGLILAALLGSYFVQISYSSGSPDIVVAGLTVIDPIVGVTVGIAVLGEASQAPAWAAVAFVVAGLIAIFGVIRLSRHKVSVPTKGPVSPGAVPEQT